MAEPHEESSKPIAEISHEPSKLEGFLDKNQKWLIVVAVLIAVGVAAYVVNQGVEEGAQRAGGEAMVAADAPEDYEEVAETHAATPSGVSAAVRLSDLQWEQGQQAAALETLRGVIERAPGHPAIPPAKARLGARLIEQGEFDRAAEVFDALVDSPRASYLAPYALSSLAEIERQRDKPEAAAETLDQAMNAYPATPFNRVLSQQMRFVNFEMPEEVEPPAAEETADGESELRIDDADMPDFSSDIELDPGQATDSGNPLLDDLAGEEDSPLESDPDRRETPPSPDDQATETPEASPGAADAAEDEAPEPEDDSSDSTSPSADPAAANGE